MTGMRQPTEPGFYWAHDGNGQWEPVRLELRPTLPEESPEWAVSYFDSDYSVDLDDGQPSGWGPWKRIVWGPRIEPPPGSEVTLESLVSEVEEAGQELVESYRYECAFSSDKRSLGLRLFDLLGRLRRLNDAPR